MPNIDSETFYLEMGRLINSERLKKGISQEILAGQLDLTRASIINLEKGRHKPSVYQLLLIAEILQIHYTLLIPTDTVEEQKQQKDFVQNLDNAITDQDCIDTSTKTVLMNFLTSLK